jgi:xanthine dehydrogenase accessory factor
MRVLRWAIETPARYVGMIGSKRKVLTVYKELEQEGVRRELLERVHAPIGLDIGAVTPEEIAVAIVAEMIAVRRNAPTAVKSKSVQIQAASAQSEA